MYRTIISLNVAFLSAIKVTSKQRSDAAVLTSTSISLAEVNTVKERGFTVKRVLFPQKWNLPFMMPLHCLDMAD